MLAKLISEKEVKVLQGNTREKVEYKGRIYTNPLNNPELPENALTELGYKNFINTPYPEDNNEYDFRYEDLGNDIILVWVNVNK